jgi:hypothetical protein
MKKTLLSLVAFAMLSTAAFAQNFTNSGTGFEDNCQEGSEAGKYGWVIWGPAAGGGFNNELENEIRIQWGMGGKSYVKVSYELGSGTTGTVDLSANPVVNVMMRSSLFNETSSIDTPTPMTYRVSLEAGRDGGTVVLTDSILANVTGTKSAFSFDFTNHVKNGVDLKNVTKVTFIYDSNIDPEVTTAARIYFSEFKAGSFATLGVEDELLSRISESVVYPNPTSGQVNVKLHLNTTSNVKVVLKDAQGNAVRTLTEQSTNAIDQAFNVSDLASGLYFISYQIEGAAVKTQKLFIN